MKNTTKPNFKITKISSDKEPEFVKYVKGVITEFTPILLMQRHTFEVEPLEKGDTNSRNALMACIYNYPYLNVCIKYAPKVLEMWQKGKDIVPYIVHEMCHPITDPLYAKATAKYVSQDEILDERENLPDVICNIALRLAHHDSRK